MEDKHEMTDKDKLVLKVTLGLIFFGVFFLGLLGLIINISSWG